MGNCLKSPTSDDISLLHESQSDRASFGDGTDADLEPPPPYQVRDGEQKLGSVDSRQMLFGSLGARIIRFSASTTPCYVVVIFVLRSIGHVNSVAE